MKGRCGSTTARRTGSAGTSSHPLLSNHIEIQTFRSRKVKIVGSFRPVGLSIVGSIPHSGLCLDEISFSRSGDRR
jgi:hypothetical protein